MKLFLRSSHSLLLSCVILLVPLVKQLQAQTLAAHTGTPTNSQPNNPYQGEEQELSTVLSKLSEKFGTEFNYDSETVQHKKVTQKVLKTIEKEDLESSLQILLAPLGLDFKKFEDASYAIYPQQEKQSIQKVERKSSTSDILYQDESSSKQDGLVSSRKRAVMLDQHVKVLEQTISGKVTDGESGDPLPGVNVLAKGTTTGTVTDVEGNYRLTVNDNISTLVYSSIGYQTEEVEINGRSVIDLTLMPDIQSLSEVVVVGYGTQKKSDLTGAISSISSESLAETPASNVLEQSQGRLAGVDIVRANGSPGSPVQIRVRGNRSINASNEPLYVIDGIPTTAGINNFNPNDIASMEVLKDASAVAIYGSRGANGVVLITTKKGQAGKAVVSYDGYYGVKQPVENLNLMNAQQFTEYSRISRGIDPNDASQDDTFFSDIEIENLQNGVDTDWLGLVLQDGTQQDHQVSVSGGSENVTYYLSGSYYNEEGIIQNSDFNRYAFRANIEAKLSEKLKIGLSSTVARNLRNQMSNAPYNAALRFSPLIEPYGEEGEFDPYPNPREGLLAHPLLNYQPLQYVDETKSYRVFANIYAEYQILDGLSYRLNYGPDYNSVRRGRYNGSLGGSINSASVRNRTDFAYTLENILSYDKQFGDHAINVVGLFSVQESEAEFSQTNVQDIPIEKSGFNNLGSAATITGVADSLGNWGLLSYMGRINYRLKEKYLFTLTGRADGSSRLAEGNKWAFFPAVSAGWIISEEDFLSVSSISFLKLRAGYGEVGNTAIDPFQTLGGLARTIYVFGDNQGFGFGQNQISNPDLGWEISKTTNFGLDYGLLEDRITGSIEYYITNTENLLLERLIPITSGFSSILQNIGATRNSGWEFNLNANVINSNGGFTWDVNLNAFSNNEEIVELFEGQSDDVGNRWFIGEPINVFYSFKQNGIWQSDEATEAEEQGQFPGDIRIADVNGRDENGELTDQPDGVINSDDRTILGSDVPDWSGGMTNRFSYKGFDLSFLVYARQGQWLRSDYHDLGGNNWQGRYNSLNLDYWTVNNPTNAYPLPDAGEAPLYSDAVRYFDGSFVKIKNITLGYNFQNDFISRVGLSSLRLYTTVNNAITFSDYDWVDPETSNGIVGAGSPLTTATYIFGVNLKF
ncbi:TonB-dependent receptor [Catalinimonas sp. 4WD22]|uniref:SusC/RagA family TonB-linked outer membrane protein n=1 Tax=Catalinimonas locisalis TaxID=3133978 RepID=UPI003100CF92